MRVHSIFVALFEGRLLTIAASEVVEVIVLIFAMRAICVIVRSVTVLAEASRPLSLAWSTSGGIVPLSLVLNIV